MPANPISVPKEGSRNMDDPRGPAAFGSSRQPARMRLMGGVLPKHQVRRYGQEPQMQQRLLSTGVSTNAFFGGGTRSGLAASSGINKVTAPPTEEKLDFEWAYRTLRGHESAQPQPQPQPQPSSQPQVKRAASRPMYHKRPPNKEQTDALMRQSDQSAAREKAKQAPSSSVSTSKPIIKPPETSQNAQNSNFDENLFDGLDEHAFDDDDIDGDDDNMDGDWTPAEKIARIDRDFDLDTSKDRNEAAKGGSSGAVSVKVKATIPGLGSLAGLWAMQQAENDARDVRNNPVYAKLKAAVGESGDEADAKPLTKFEQEKAEKQKEKEERARLVRMKPEELLAYYEQKNGEEDAPTRSNLNFSPDPSPQKSKPRAGDAQRDMLANLDEALLARGVDVAAVQEEERQRQEELKKGTEDWRDVVPDELEDEAGPVGKLCPFCDEPLPARPSLRLRSLIAWLSRRPHAKRRPTPQNPDAIYLPTHETIACCARHRNESVVIPEGERRGYPKTINFAALPKRLKALQPHLNDVAKGIAVSDFLENARRDFKARGGTGQMALGDEMASFAEEQPGYYGERGFEVIHAFLVKSYTPLGQPSRITEAARGAIPAPFFLRRVLVPETALYLIADDLSLPPTDPKVRQTLEQSREYGAAVFAADQREDEAVESDEEDRKERKRVQKAKKPVAKEQVEKKPAQERTDKKQKDLSSWFVRKQPASGGTAEEGRSSTTGKGKKRERTTTEPASDAAASAPRKKRSVDGSQSQQSKPSTSSSGLPSSPAMLPSKTDTPELPRPKGKGVEDRKEAKKQPLSRSTSQIIDLAESSPEKAAPPPPRRPRPVPAAAKKKHKAGENGWQPNMRTVDLDSDSSE